MNEEKMIAYAQVDSILSQMDYTEVNKIPMSLLKEFKQYKNPEYMVYYDKSLPLEAQDLSKEAKVILASLKYKFLCNDEKQRKEMLRKFDLDEDKTIEYTGDINQRSTIKRTFKDEIFDSFKNSRFMSFCNDAKGFLRILID